MSEEKKASPLARYISEKSAVRPVYMPYLTAGDPSFEDTAEFAVAMIDAGADLIELGIPFSDPTADGPVIQAAMVRSMQRSDFSLGKVFETAHKIHEQRPGTPIVFLTYLNPVLTGGTQLQSDRHKLDVEQSVADFQNRSLQAGVSGVVIPDLPFDSSESKTFRRSGRQNNIDQILMLAPNTEKNRFKQICKEASGFIYYVTSMGVTGERKDFAPELASRMKEARLLSGTPVMAGFGFSRPEQTLVFLGIVDGIIVGSLHHSIIQEKGKESRSELVRVTEEFVKTLSRGL